MMKFILTILILSLSLASATGAQRSKGKRQARRPPAAKPATAKTAPIIGQQVTLVTKNGDRITGQLLDLTAYSVRVKANDLESTIALDTLASLSFGAAAADATTRPRTVDIRPEFARDVGAVLNSFQSVASGLNAGLDYSGYDRQVAELRRATERFAQKYSATESTDEARMIALLTAALTDYTWARTIWTLILGRPTGTTLGQSDSLAVADTLALYPDLREGAASGNKYVAEKLIAGLWRKAYDKTERARALMGKS
ncbi:MAG TPA: hypothetical protein VNO70_19955 [Blastocatellia bacterium]|nr:hypothetical protein [Blastocatellia bacterium]